MIVIPAEAGIQCFLQVLDSRFHGNDKQIRYAKASIEPITRSLLVSSPPNLWDTLSLERRKTLDLDIFR
jgi:hypothetical protein